MLSPYRSKTWPKLPENGFEGDWRPIHEFLKKRFKHHVRAKISRSCNEDDVEAWMVEQFGVRVIGLTKANQAFWTVGVWHHLIAAADAGEFYVDAYFLLPEHALAFKLRWQ